METPEAWPSTCRREISATTAEQARIGITLAAAVEPDRLLRFELVMEGPCMEGTDSNLTFAEQMFGMLVVAREGVRSGRRIPAQPLAARAAAARAVWPGRLTRAAAEEEAEPSIVVVQGFRVAPEAVAS